MKEIWQIELNKIDNETNHYMYLKDNGAITDDPSTALQFDTFEECEKYRKQKDYGNVFHTQKMMVNNFGAEEMKKC